MKNCNKYNEDYLQTFVIFFLRKVKKEYKESFPFMFWSIPNGGFRTKSTALTMKNTGVLAGVLDLQLVGNGWIHFIEMKMGNGKLSDAQKEFIKGITSFNISHDVVYADTPQEAVIKVKDIMIKLILNYSVKSVSSSKLHDIAGDVLSSSILKEKS